MNNNHFETTGSLGVTIKTLLLLAYLCKDMFAVYLSLQKLQTKLPTSTLLAFKNVFTRMRLFVDSSPQVQAHLDMLLGALRASARTGAFLVLRTSGDFFV